MAVSVEQLSVDLGILSDSTEPLDAAQRQVVTRLHSYALEIVNDRAPTAPESLRDMALVTLAGYQYDRVPASQGAGFADAFVNSGASSMLSRWIDRRAIAISGDAPDVSVPSSPSPSPAVPGVQGTRYLGAWNGLSGPEKAAIQIGDVVLNHGRFWISHIVATARVSEPGGVSVGQLDGWHATPPTSRGVAPVAQRHYDPLDIATVSGAHFICLIEGNYNASEVHAGTNWAALSSGGVTVTEVEGLINVDRASTITQVQGFLDNYTLTTGLTAVLNSLVVAWARAGATSFVPAARLPAATVATPGVVHASRDDDVDETQGVARLTTALAYTIEQFKRFVFRLVPAWARDTTTQIPADKLGNAPGATGGLGQAAVDARVRALVSDWAEADDTSTLIPVGRYRPITVATNLPAPNAAVGSQFYGTGGSHADRIFWPKRIADRKTVVLRTAHLTEARGDQAIVGWQADPEIGLVRPPWADSLAVARFVIEPSGAGWRISMSGGAGLAHPVGIIITGIGTQTITLFRRVGTGNDAPIYDSAVSSAVRQFVAGASYSIRIRYSGGQNFFNVHDSDYLEQIASAEDTYDLQAEIDRLESQVASLAASAGGGGSERIFNGTAVSIAPSQGGRITFERNLTAADVGKIMVAEISEGLAANRCYWMGLINAFPASLSGVVATLCIDRDANTRVSVSREPSGDLVDNKLHVIGPPGTTLQRVWLKEAP